MIDEKARMRKLSGRGISPGLAIGRAFVYQDILQRDHERYDIEADQIPEEYARIERAMQAVRTDLELAAEIVADEANTDLAEVFRAHQMMLSDPLIQKDIRQEIETELVNAEHVVKRVFRRWERRFRAAEDESPARPGDDIADVGRRLLRHLAGIQAHTLEDIPSRSVVVARRLLPSDTVFLSRQSTVATVVEFAGPLSHAALLTRELGVPAVSQIPNILDLIVTGEPVFVDGSSGTVIVDPDPETHERFRAAMARQQGLRARAHEHCHEPARTADGVTIEVMANVSCREDVQHAVEEGADGVGLYRIENTYLSRQVPPSEEDLLADLRHALEPIRGRSVTVRLLDAGGDKELPFLNLPLEPNPFLGRRGVRLLLDYPELLVAQLKALLRLRRDHDVRILVPMVTLAQEMARVRQELSDLARDSDSSDIPPLGAMIETPAAALCTGEIAEYVDFLSIGTNDLTQYTMAAGRENPLVSDYFVDDHLAIRRLLRAILDGAGDTPVSICGELAAREGGLKTAVELGIRSVSVATPMVAKAKQAVAVIRAQSTAEAPKNQEGGRP